MTLAEQLIDYVNAACTGLWIHTSEPDEAEREIACLARERYRKEKGSSACSTRPLV